MTCSQRVLYHIIRGSLRLAGLLPAAALYALSDFAAWIMRDVVGYRRGLVGQNLRRAFPDASEEERQEWGRRFYGYLCDVFVETARLARISDAEMARRVEVRGAAIVNDALASGKSVILYLGHYGNWEWVTYAARHFLPGAVMCEIYHPLSNKVMDRVMLGLRSRFGTENIPMSRAVRRLIEIDRSGCRFVCGFIADQRPFTPELKHWTDFMGIDTPYVNGGEVIGSRLGAAYVYAEMLPVARGRYRLEFRRLNPIDAAPRPTAPPSGASSPSASSATPDGACQRPIATDNPYTRAYLRELEHTIRRNPPYWLWSHNRWKRSR